MAHQVIWSEQAQQDIHNILNYLTDNWSDTIAERFSDQMIKSSEQLEQQPYLGRTHDQISSIKIVVIRPYHKIVYTVIDAMKVIYVLNVLDTRRE